MKYFLLNIMMLLCVGCSTPWVVNKTESLKQPLSSTSTSEIKTQSDVEIRTRFWLERAKRDSYDPIARIKAGTSLLLLARESGNHALYLEAELILRESLAIGPGSYEGLVMLAFALAGQHRFTEAAHMAKQAIEVDPYKETAWAAWGDAEFELGHMSEARQAYTKVMQFDRSLFALTRWANLELAEGRYLVALSSLAEGAKIGNNRGVSTIEVSRCYIQMGEIHFQRGQFEQAEKYYQQALSLWDEGYLPMEHMAELRASQNKLKLSSKLYAKVIQLLPHPDLLEAYAGVLERLGKRIEARQLYQQALDNYLLASEQGDPSYFRHLSLFLTDKRQQPQQALIWAKKDLAIRPVPLSYATLAWVQYHMGRYTQAEQAMDKALVREESLNAIWLYRAGVVYQQGKRKKLAKRLLKQALLFNQHHPEAEVIQQLLSPG